MTLVRRFLVDQVQCVDKNGANPKPLSAATVAVRMDASWAPYVQVTLTGTPPSDADLTAIDPRQGWRVKFRLQAFDASSSSGTPIASWSLNLAIRSRTRTYGPSPSITLEAATAEAALQDYFLGYTETFGGGTAATINASQWAQGTLNIIGGVTLNVITGAPDVAVQSADAGFTPDSNAWDYIATMAEAAGARVYCDETNALLWTAPNYTPTPGTTDLTAIVQVDDVVSRDDPAWGNFAVVTYSGNSPAQYATSDSGLSPRKGIAITRNRRKPGTGNGATKVRTTAQARGRNLTVQAIADLTVRPMQTRRAAYQGQSWTGLVQSVDFELPAGTMTVVLNVVES